MDCNTTIVRLTVAHIAAHVIILSIFAGYRIIIKKHFAKIEKNEEELKKRVEELEKNNL